MNDTEKAIDLSGRDDTIFSIPLKVRDYECDMQGIVNNSVYMQYLEHARHEYLNKIGLNFKALIDKGLYLVAVQAELFYKIPLLSGQEFTVTCKMVSESKFKVRFIQEIYNKEEEKILIGNIIAATINQNKKPILIKDVFDRMLV